MLQTRTLLSLLAIAGTASFFARTASAKESTWPRYRGPDGFGHVTDRSTPVKWGASDVAWRTELGGEGQSSPCIWGSYVFLTTAEKRGGDVTRSVVCVKRNDGSIAWRTVASTGPAEKVHGMNSYATATCATDGKHVVAFFGRGGIHCLTVGGKKRWSRDLGSFPGPWGTAASPIIVSGAVIQNCDAQGASSLVAFDLRTGRVVWKTPREAKPRGGWNTPVVITVGRRREIIVNGEFGVRGYDLASGRELWFCKAFTGRGTPTPAWGGGLLYVINGKAGDAYAVRPGGRGNVTSSRMAWHTPRKGGRDIASPVYVKGRVLAVDSSGRCTCYEATSGHVLWKERIGGSCSASPLVINGRVYFQTEKAEVVVVEPGPALKIVSRNSLGAPDGEIFRSTMAPLGARVYLRSNKALYCVGR